MLAAFSLFAIWLDPSEPAKYTQVAYTLLAAYVVYALLIALLVWRASAPLIGLRYVTHAGDLLIFTVLMYLTEGPTSPFFVYFIFSLFCATLYWQWRGIVWTAVVALTFFLGLGIYATEVLRDATFELNRFMIRSVYLVVVATLLSYLSVYHQRLYSEMAKLASWSPVALPDVHALVRDILQHTAEILVAPRVLMIWDEPEEPWRHVAWWAGGEFHWTRESPATFEPLVAEPLVDTNFLCPVLKATAPMVLYQAATGLQRWSGMPLHADLHARFAPDAVLAIRLRSERLQGRLFCFDTSALTSDALLLGTVVAHEVVARLEQYYLLQQVQQAAVAEERICLARNLHDGLLQSLAGAAMHLAAISHLLEQEPQKARERLTDVQQLLETEQQDLRFLIQALRPSPCALSETVFALVPRLEELGQRIERLWGLQVDMRLEGLDIKLSNALTQGIYHIVHEALINAARHAGATAIVVELGLQDKSVCLTVRDNGHGFPFCGQYDLTVLTALALGPKMLRERVVSLGGDLAIDSTTAGTCLHITLPLV